MKQPKINPDIQNKLFSSNTKEVISAINQLKETGNKTHLPVLFELLLSKPEDEIEKEIKKLLGTVKDKDTIPVFVDAIRNPKLLDVRKEILTTCWQNGLDFSNNFEAFANVIINDSWEIAFEAFTVIENLEHFPPQESLQEVKLKLAGALKSADDQKAYLLEEILKML